MLARHASVYSSRPDPLGRVRTSEGSPLPTDYTFTGQKIDASDALMYYGARYYDPYLNRWTQPDTLVPGAANPQNFNRYTYVLNNPLRYTDPTGNKTAECLPGDPDCDPGGNLTPPDPCETNPNGAGCPGAQPAAPMPKPTVAPSQDGCNPSVENCHQPEKHHHNNGNGNNNNGYQCNPDIEEALAATAGSPTAQHYIDYVRQHYVFFEFDSWMPEGRGLTWQNIIHFSSVYESSGGVVGGYGNGQMPNYWSVSGKPIPPDLLIHEIVHITQGPPVSFLGQMCGCSLDHERQAYTVQDTVRRELDPSVPDRFSPWKDPLSDATAGPGGAHTADPWQPNRYEQFRRDLGGIYWTFPIQ
jgi:RHS repeat-associated protein